MARPGIMVYFNILEPIKGLSDEDRGKLLVAMLEYGQDGVIPKLEGPLAFVWPFIRQMIDKDEQRYDDMKIQREYAVFCKKRKRIMMPKILFEDWIVMTDDERERAVDPVASRYPTTTTSTVSVNKDNKQSTTDNEQLQSQYQTTNDNLHLQEDEEDGNGGDERKVVKAIGGSLGKGVVFMSDDQVDDLLSKMGIQAFDHYVDKLSDFIIKNGARVKSHYETVLKWWKEDSLLQ